MISPRFSPQFVSSLSCMVLCAVISPAAAQPTQPRELPEIVRDTTPTPEVERFDDPDEPSLIGANGVLLEVDGQKMTYKADKTAENLTKVVSPEAQLYLNGDPTKLSQLKPGDRVWLFVPEAEPKLVVRVRATRGTPSVGPAESKPMPPQSESNSGSQAGLGVAVTDSPNQGILVLSTTKRSPADRAGITLGDFLMAMDSKPIQTPESFLQQLDRHSPGDTVAVKVWRRGEPRLVNITLSTQSMAADRSVDDPRPDLATAQELAEESDEDTDSEPEIEIDVNVKPNQSDGGLDADNPLQLDPSVD